MIYRACLIAVLSLASAVGTRAEDSKTALVLYDGGREFKSIELTDRGIELGLNEARGTPVTIFREYLDVTRIQSADYEATLRRFYRAKYSANVPDVIVAIRGRALDFLLKHGEELFPGVPIVSAAMDERQLKARNLPRNVTGNTLKVRYWPSVQLALALQPDIENIFVILGASPNDHALEALVRDEFSQTEHGVRFTYLAGFAVDGLLKRVATLPPRSAVLFAGFAIDGTGRSFLPQDVLPRIASAARAPTYVASDDVLDSGAVGGDVISFEAVGKDSGKLAARILAGENPASMAITESSARVKVLDARQLNRWAIPLSHVPPGSLVMHREPTLWEAYRWWIAAGISLILLQTGLIATLLVQRRLRRLAEANLGISEAHGRAAVLEERNRMARDMHDTLAQGFTGVIVQLEAAQQAAAQGSERDVDGHIQRANALARQSLGEARRSIRALRPQALENTALCLALDEVTKQMTAGTAVRARFTISGQPRPLNPSNEDNLLRIYQETLTNALRHAQAKTIESSLSFDSNVVRLDVRDDGGGFELGTKHDGLGLLGIRERVSQMKGELIVESKLGTGTHVSVALPD